MAFADLAAVMAADIAEGLGVPGAVIAFAPWTPGFDAATGKPGDYGPAVAITAVRGQIEVRRESVPGSASPGRTVELVTYAWPAAADATAALARAGDRISDGGVHRTISAVRRPGAGAVIEADTRREVSA